MTIHDRHARACIPRFTRLTVLLAALMLGAAPALAQPGKAVPALADDELAVSTGSWYCSRYLDAAAAPAAAHAADVASRVRQFALGYVYGVSEAVGKPFPESAANQTRILALLGKACAEDGARAVRDATLLAGRAMLDDSRSGTGTVASDATGASACSVYLDAPPGGAGRTARATRDAVQNWADGYINARFERAGRGLIPTAKNKALMLDRFSAACAGEPAGSVREAARRVVDATLPKK